MRIFLSVSALFLVFSGWTQSQQLNYEEEKWPLHQVIHFYKSNWDGSNKGFISVYFKDDEWIESMKWHEGSSQVSIIPARIDHSNFSVAHFKNIRCVDGVCNQLGEMFRISGTNDYRMDFGSFQDTINNIPSYWHSYDFDWASLMVAFLFKEESKFHSFKRCDFSMIDGKPEFGIIGMVNMEYQSLEERQGAACHVFGIDGPGLQNQGGEIWFRKKDNLLMGFRIQLPDEDSYQNVDFRFLNKEEMTNDQWEEFKRSIWEE